MKLSSKKIVEATERYYRERDRYEKLTRYIEEKCIYELIDRLGLQVNITARTKRVNSFEGKLRRFREWNKKPEWTTIDHVFGGLSDFSCIASTILSAPRQLPCPVPRWAVSSAVAV